MGSTKLIRKLSIEGLRGFGKRQEISFSLPNGNRGSGISFLVGSNNSGKTTILEALRLFNVNGYKTPSISERKRNRKCNYKVNIDLVCENNDCYSISTHEHGGSTTRMMKNGDDSVEFTSPSIFVLQSRRSVDVEFHWNEVERYDYVRRLQANTHNRTSSLDFFNARLFSMHRNKDSFDPLLQEILGHGLEWTIEQNDSGTHYLKFEINGCVHSSEGLGDGIWSVFTICDALYDADSSSVIAIDEPELSLHPALQKRTMNLIKKYAKDRQIIIATHSPYFIDWEAITNGAELLRTVKSPSGDIEVHNLSHESREAIKRFLSDYHQPHTLGIEAKEVFFLEDNIILVEGQEDAVFYPIIAKQLNLDFDGNIFGWGVGGADKMEHVIRILKDLGYKKVCVVFDGDRKQQKDKLEQKYLDYAFFVLPADDVRYKKPRPCSPAKHGIVDSTGCLNEGFSKPMKELISAINKYFQPA